MELSSHSSTVATGSTGSVLFLGGPPADTVNTTIVARKLAFMPIHPEQNKINGVSKMPPYRFIPEDTMMWHGCLPAKSFPKNLIRTGRRECRKIFEMLPSVHARIETRQGQGECIDAHPIRSFWGRFFCLSMFVWYRTSSTTIVTDDTTPANSVWFLALQRLGLERRSKVSRRRLRMPVRSF